jgi:hypothetical protein
MRNFIKKDAVNRNDTDGVVSIAASQEYNVYRAEEGTVGLQE